MADCNDSFDKKFALSTREDISKILKAFAIDKRTSWNLRYLEQYSQELFINCHCEQ